MAIQQPPDDVFARRLHRAFEEAGEELFLVGGAVRDELLSRPSGDLDFATSARPEKTLSILEGVGAGSPHRIGEKFGTIGLQTPDGRAEITTYRAEQYDTGSRKPHVQFGASLLEDLQRRDFTINAIAQDPRTRDYIDPFHGRQDLTTRTIRAVGSPHERFTEDPLRLLRAVRFAARLDFAIDRDTWDAVIDRRDDLSAISRERVRDEYEKILSSGHPVRGMTMLRDSGLLSTSVPELLILATMPDHGPSHPLSLWDHTMNVLAAVHDEPRSRWAALLHDIGKPVTKSLEPDGRTRFFHHEEVGAQLTRKILGGLRYPNAFIRDVATLVDIHMQIHAYSTEWSDGAVRRLANRLGPLLPSALDLVRADANGHSLVEPSHNAPKFDALEVRIAAVSDGMTEGLRSPLSGDDLMRRFSRPPGPWIGAIKEMLENEVIEGRLAIDDRAAAWALAEQMTKPTVVP